jgi:hypothetical protein
MMHRTAVPRADPCRAVRSRRLGDTATRVFVYNGGVDFDEPGEFVVSRGPNVVLEVIDASAMSDRDRPASSEAVAGHGAVHVELRPAAAKRLVALLLGHRGG